MPYEGLLAMIKAERQEEALLLSKTPTFCPNDHTALEKGPNNELHCPFDGWIWDGTPGVDA